MRYKLGNFGQVWRARLTPDNSQYTNNGQIVAVKTNKLTADEKDANELLDELDIMIKLRSVQENNAGHENVVKLIGCCTENGKI